MSQAAVINPFDRLGLTLFFAVSLHTVLILGVGFDFNPSKPRIAERTLEIMVVHNARKPKEPEKADFSRPNKPSREREPGRGRQAEDRTCTTTPACTCATTGPCTSTSS